tara:strand:+ start:1692 stop:1928 length:237 start_codon:yes stop_codon:yes gene_type:complete
MAVSNDKDIIQIEGERDYVRDKNSKAILSNNREGLRAYKIKRIQMQRVLEYENDINTLKSEISEIRTVLDVIVNKLNN